MIDPILLFAQKYALDLKLRHLLEERSISQLVQSLIQNLREEKQIFIDISLVARDIYIGSDFNAEEKKIYEVELFRQDFFTVLAKFLYNSDVSIQSWTIYTFGKFSLEQNIPFLEEAYIREYRNSNPILACRCLNELHWLGSKRFSFFIKELESNNDFLSEITLLYHDFDVYIQKVKNEELKRIIQFDSLTAKEIEDKLLRFEIQYFNHINNSESVGNERFKELFIKLY